MTDTDKALPDNIEAMTFEQALESLRTLVGTLERGEASLEDSIKAYERGSQLRAHCETKLKEASAKIEMISQDADGNIDTEPFQG